MFRLEVGFCSEDTFFAASGCTKQLRSAVQIRVRYCDGRMGRVGFGIGVPVLGREEYC